MKRLEPFGLQPSLFNDQDIISSNGDRANATNRYGCPPSATSNNGIPDAQDDRQRGRRDGCDSANRLALICTHDGRR